MVIDAQALTASLRRLTSPGQLDTGLVPTLTRLIEACVDLFGVTGSGIMLADEQNLTRYVTATDGPGRVLEVAESDTGQGPCTVAFVNNHLVASTDLATETQWPDLAAAVAPHRVHAVLGIPVRIGAVTVGTLDVYRDHPHDWDDTEKAAILRYGDVLESALTSALAAHTAGELAGQLQYALEHRVAIERGIGYLMALHRVDAMQAFNRLRRTAHATGRQIGDVVEELITTGQLPDTGR